jgi:hypothetical protein
MKNQKRISINLATYPMRNNRLFYLFFGLLAGCSIFVSVLAGYTYIKYRDKNTNFLRTKTQIEEKLRNVQREERRLSTQIEKASQKYQGRIDLVNTLIYRKSFSWLNFLSALEESLPASCFIVSLAPSLKENSKIEVRFKVASPNLRELLVLNRNLAKKNFTEIRTVSEGRNAEGLLVSEMTLIYERII